MIAVAARLTHAVEHAKLFHKDLYRRVNLVSAGTQATASAETVGHDCKGPIGIVRVIGHKNCVKQKRQAVALAGESLKCSTPELKN